jgi:outer membrane protein insertion porin family
MALGALIGSGLGMLGGDVAFGSPAILCTSMATGNASLVDRAQACAVRGEDPAARSPFPVERPGIGPVLPHPQYGQLISSSEASAGESAESDRAAMTPEDDANAPSLDLAPSLVDGPGLSLSRGGLTLSGGYSTIERFRVRAQLTRTFVESAKELTATASYSSLRVQASVGFSADQLPRRPIGYTVSAFAARQKALGFTDVYKASPFEQRSAGIDMGLRRSFTPSFTASTNLRLSREEFRLTSSAATCDPTLYTRFICQEIRRTNQAEWTVGLSFDHRDNPINPTQGYRFRLSEKLVAYKGALQYAKTEAGYEHHFRYGDEWTISTSVEGGMIKKIGSQGAPIFDRFYLGGPGLHGFDLRGVGPKIAASAPTGIRASVGGSYYYSARAELVGNVGGYLGASQFRPSLYVEAGSAFSIDRNRLLPAEQLTGSKAAPRISLGMALRWPTPVGNLRLDLALPVVSRKGDRKQIFSISVGV